MAFANDPIRHVVVLMLENRSFDQLLGDLQRVDPARGIDGIDRQHPRSNPYPGENPVEQQANALAALPKKFDPKHELSNVVRQLGGTANPTMDGFVADAAEALGGADGFGRDDIAQVMAYFPAEQNAAADPLPALRTLARTFTVCDRWYSSLPGPTWPNRFFSLCGTAAGHVRMPESIGDVGLLFKAYDMPTIFDRLRDAGRSCRIFHDGVSLSMLLRRTWFYPEIYGGMDEFDEAIQADEADFPEFAFIEPKYFSLFSDSQNDQHPPHDMRRGDQLLARVYNGIRANDALWQSTLLVVLYDEHGGFYDHAVPPKTVSPDGIVADVGGFAFDRLGVRVPALLVSPHVSAGGVDHGDYDHTSLLAYLCRKWDLAPLGARCAQANSFENAIVAGAIPDAPARVPQVTVRATRALAPEDIPLNENQRALALMVDFIHQQLGIAAPAPMTRGLEAGVRISGDQVERKAQQALALLKTLGLSAPRAGVAAPGVAPAAVRAGAPLKVLMVHGIGHGDDPNDQTWKDRWEDAFRKSARAAGYPGADTLQFVFANFDAIFEKYPLDPFTIVRGVMLLGRHEFGPGPVFGTRDIAQRGLHDVLRWTAGMVIQWIENEDLRRELRDSLLTQFHSSGCELVCAHSLGAMACYDAFRRLVANREAAALDGKHFLTFGGQMAHPAVQSVFGGRIEPLYDASGHGFGQWFHLYNPHDTVFTRPLPGADARTHTLTADFDIPGDPLNHDGAWYLEHSVTASAAMPAILPPAAATRAVDPSVLRSIAAPAVVASTHARRRALLVGINDYPDPSMRLEGCVNDVYLVSAVLQECGFAADDIRVLTDRRATRDGMLERLAWLSDGVQAGDERVLFYSGHGAQMPAYGTTGEPEKVCETLVPADFDWSPGHAFTDREFHTYYSHLPYDCRFLGIFDCCHAGGMTRGGHRVRGINPPDDVRHRTLRWDPARQMWVPRDFVEVSRKAARSFELRSGSGDDGTRGPIERSGLGESASLRLQSSEEYDRARRAYGHHGPYLPMLVFAAGQTELAAEYEHGPVSYGAFTFALAKQLRGLRRPPTFRRLITAVRQELGELGYQQRPSITGPKELLGSTVPILRWRNS